MLKPLYFIYCFNRLKTRTLKLYFKSLDRGNEPGEDFNIFYSKSFKTVDALNATMHRRVTFVQTRELAVVFTDEEEAETMAKLLSKYCPEKCQLETVYIEVTDLIPGKGIFTGGKVAGAVMEGERGKKRKKKIEPTAEDLEAVKQLQIFK